MKKIIPFVLFLFAVLAVSCSKDNPYEEYEGSWSGTYSGGDTGTWMVTINEEGKVNGTAISDSLPGIPFTATGTISESGQLSVQATVLFSVVEFDGQLSNSFASGTWINRTQNLSGTWTGTKQ